MLYVIRHGQTDWNYNKITMGQKDIPLNKEGIRQAHLIKKIISKYDINIIICSPLKRAKNTAKIIKKQDDIILYDNRIIERNLGELEGKPYTQDNNRIWDININTSDYHIETMEEFKERVYSFLNDITKKYHDKNLLLVTHGGVSALIDCYFNGCLSDGPISNKFLDNCKVAIYKK